MRDRLTPILILIATLMLPYFIVLGCSQEENGADDTSASEKERFVRAVPTAETLSLEVPDSAGSGALAVGDPSMLYEMTRGVSLGVNAHVGVMLLYINAITLLPPTSIDETRAVWGPTEPEGLEKAAWRLTITHISGDDYAIALDGRPKASTSDADFVTVISGQVTTGLDRVHSKGSLDLLFDNASALGTDLCRTGTIRAEWDNTGEGREIGVVWERFVDVCDSDEVANAVYLYTEAEDASGTFSFVNHANIHAADEQRPGEETITINSRWQGDGTGRSDIVLESDEIAADLAGAGLEGTSVQASQCWSDLFALTFADTAPDELEAIIFPHVGAEADCAFEAQFPQPAE